MGSTARFQFPFLRTPKSLMHRSNLKGRRILVVEDEYMLASEMKRELQALGVLVLGPVGRVGAALDLLGSEADIDGAVIDMNLGGEMAYPVAEALADRHIPVVLTTGYDVTAIPARFAQLPRCEKPVDLDKVTRAISEVLGG